MKDDGSPDLSHINELGYFLEKNINRKITIIQKSTVPIGYNEKFKNIFSAEIAKRKKQIKFNIISNPEFLSEGTAVENFLHPQRIIAGVEN